MKPTPGEGTWSLRGIQEMLGLSRGVVTGLIAAGFVSPGRGPGSAYRFTFQDVVLLRTAASLQAARIPPRRIVQALRQLRAELPDALPLTGLRITAVGNEVTVRDASSPWQAESGQRLMDFDLAPARGSLAFLPHAAAPAPSSALAAETGDAESAFETGEALEASDREAAESAYRQVLKLDPDHADAYLNLGALLCEDGRCAEALGLYDEAIRRHPGEALLHFNRAIALEDRGRLGAALASYDAALRLAPDLADAHFNAARLHEQRGDARKALRHFSAYRRLQR